MGSRGRCSLRGFGRVDVSCTGLENDGAESGFMVKERSLSMSKRGGSGREFLSCCLVCFDFGTLFIQLGAGYIGASGWMPEFEAPFAIGRELLLMLVVEIFIAANSPFILSTIRKSSSSSKSVTWAIVRLSHDGGNRALMFSSLSHHD